MHHLLDASIVYLYYPVIAVMMTAMVEMTLPLLVDVYEDSREIHAKWRGMLGISGDMKYFKRKLRSISVIAVYGGINSYNFYKCKKSTKLTYISAVLNYTITATLSIDIGRGFHYQG